MGGIKIITQYNWVTLLLEFLEIICIHMGVLRPSKWRKIKRQAWADCVRPSWEPTSLNKFPYFMHTLERRVWVKGGSKTLQIILVFTFYKSPNIYTGSFKCMWQTI
jgi:hypothetical protein